MKYVTACTMDCPDVCSLRVDKGADGELEIRGAPDHPFTDGFTCAKIRGHARRLASPNRILRPLLKKGGSRRPLSWEDALDLCAEKIQACRAEPASMLHIQGGGSKGVLQLVPPFFFGSLGASMTRGALCDDAGIAACVADFGALESNDIAGLIHARFIVNWGRDLSRSSVHVAALVRKARLSGTGVLSISPGGDGNGSFSDRFVRIRPGTDRFLAAAVIKLLLDRGRISPSVTGRAANWAQFKRLIDGHTVEDLLGRCGASAEDAEEIYRFYSSAGPTATLIGWGLQRHVFGGENVRFINGLAFLSGNVGRRGGGSTFNISSMRNFNRSWAAPPPGPARRTLALPSMGREILEAADPAVKMIWVNGCNVVNQAPEALTTARAFEQTPFKVVVDAFMTDTAERADLVLPCALMLEKEDIVGSFLHDFVSYSGKVVDPPGEARTDLDILRDLGKRLDPPIFIPDLETCLRDALDSPYLDVSLEELRERGHTRAKRPEVAFAGMRFGHQDSEYRFPESLHPEPSAPGDYPLRLLTLIRKNAIHSQILPEDHVPCPTVWVSPENHIWGSARESGTGCDCGEDGGSGRGGKGGEDGKDGVDLFAFLVSPLGRMKVKMKKDSGLHPDAVVYRRGDWMKLGGGANRLISARMTDMGETAAFYSQHVRLESVSDS